MKKNTVLLPFFLLWIFIPTCCQQIKNGGQPITINVNTTVSPTISQEQSPHTTIETANKLDNANQNDVQANPEQSPQLTQQTAQDTNQQNLQEALQEVAQQVAQLVEQKAQQTNEQKNTIPFSEKCRNFYGESSNIIQQFFENNKYTLLKYSFLTTYFYIIYYLVWTNQFMARSHIWGKWKRSFSLHRLRAIAPTILQKELLFSIQKKCTDIDSLQNFYDPMAVFINQIKTEKKLLQRYLTLSRWLQTLYIGIIFPYTKKTMNKAENLLKRVKFIEHLFFTWIAQNKWSSFDKQ